MKPPPQIKLSGGGPSVSIPSTPECLSEHKVPHILVDDLDFLPRFIARRSFKMGNASSAMLENIVQGSNCKLCAEEKGRGGELEGAVQRMRLTWESCEQLIAKRLRD